MGFILIIPLFIMRYGLPRMLNKDALRRAAFFAPLSGNERVAYWIYQLSNVALVVYILFSKIKLEPLWIFFAGTALYVLGIIILAISLVNFSSPDPKGVNRNGLYRISRNPMYLAYFIFFMGCVVLTQSLILLMIVLAFQISVHWIIRSEERWCIEKFGDDYIQYMKKVRRYI